MTVDEVLEIFRSAGAILHGHFILTSGLRSPVFFEVTGRSKQPFVRSGAFGSLSILSISESNAASCDMIHNCSRCGGRACREQSRDPAAGVIDPI